MKYNILVGHNKMNYTPPSKYEILQKLSQLQGQLPILMVQSEQYKNSGDIVAARVTYDELIAILSQDRPLTNEWQWGEWEIQFCL